MLPYIESPVGPLSSDHFKLAYDAGVWGWDAKNNAIVFKSYEIEIPKNGKVEKVSIPIRYYNLLWALHQNKNDFEKAIQSVRIWENDYLPAQFGFTSYSKMIDHIENLKINS